MQTLLKLLPVVLILLSALPLKAAKEKPTYNLTIVEADLFIPNDFWDTPAGKAFWGTQEGKAVLQAMLDYQLKMERKSK